MYVSFRAALAATLAVVSIPALADASRPDTTIFGDRHNAEHQLTKQPSPAPAGIMGDHVHHGGEIMVGLRASREWYNGRMRAGTQKLSDADVAALGYSVGVRSMRMDMLMLDLMWAPNDRVTLMVMPHYMKMDMVMVGLPGHGGGDGHGDEHGSHDGHGGGHAMAPGHTHDHSVQGFGDTQVAALVSLLRTPGFGLHASFGVSIPTGTVKKRNADGTYTHYMMQMGSGTWDLLPALTATGSIGRLGWGAQAQYLFRAENRNSSGYRLGDRFTGNAWLAAHLSPMLSLSGRATYVQEGDIKGHYNGPHHHSSPPDLQPNYGGRRLELGAGVQLTATGGALAGTRLGIEYVRPVYEHVNGVQITRDDALHIGITRTF